MRDWIKNIFGSQESKELSNWETSDSIFEFIKENINADGSLHESAYTLPDEKKEDDEIKFAPGLTDTMFGADDSDESIARVNELIKLITSVANNGDEHSKSEFYRAITDNESVIGIIDQFLQKLFQATLPVEPYLFNFSYTLATRTQHRNSVKFGIALLGVSQNKKTIEDIKILGLHDEFTIFSTIALLHLSNNLVDDLWELAKHVDGWGKIQIVDRLAEMDLPDEVRDWLVLEGYKNNIMHEYLTLTCAINGNLNQKLSQETIDTDLFEAAGEIIVALMPEVPIEGMSGYNEAEETIQNYIKHAKLLPLNIGNFITLHRIKDYLEESPEQNEILKNWDQNELSNSLIDIHEILISKDWTSEVTKALDSADNVEFWYGKQAAQKLGIDITDTLWKRLEKFPLKCNSWHDLITYVKHDNPQTLIDKAFDLLPIEEISTGPKNTMGTGPDWEKYQSLGFIISFLENHPTLGEKLILAGLNSPVISNRNVAIRTLQAWTSDNWSSKINTELHNLKEIEPTEATKANLEKLLNGEKIN